MDEALEELDVLWHLPQEDSLDDPESVPVVDTSFERRQLQLSRSVAKSKKKSRGDGTPTSQEWTAERRKEIEKLRGKCLASSWDDVAAFVSPKTQSPPL